MSDSIGGQPNWTRKNLNYRFLSAFAPRSHSQASRAAGGKPGRLLEQPPRVSRPPRTPACTLTQGPSQPAIAARSATYLLGERSLENVEGTSRFREPKAFYLAPCSNTNIVANGCRRHSVTLTEPSAIPRTSTVVPILWKGSRFLSSRPARPTYTSGSTRPAPQRSALSR